MIKGNTAMYEHNSKPGNQKQGMSRSPEFAQIVRKVQTADWQTEASEQFE
jgi:hypothetical protein